MVKKSVFFLILFFSATFPLSAEGLPSYLELFSMGHPVYKNDQLISEYGRLDRNFDETGPEGILRFCQLYLFTGEREDLFGVLKAKGALQRMEEEQWPTSQAAGLFILSGWHSLIQKNKEGHAAVHFASAYAQDSSSREAYFWKRVGDFLKMYKEPLGTSPVFASYNGALGNFLIKGVAETGDSLPTFTSEEAQGYFYPLLLMAPESPLVLELFGDILYYHPDPFLSRWFSSMSYLRAAQQFPEGSDDFIAYEKKSIYSLESNRVNPQTYNQYRFTQFHKTLERDLANSSSRRDSLEAAGASAQAALPELYGETTTPPEFFSDNGSGQLMELLGRERKKEMQLSARKNNPNSEITNPDLNIGEIKSTAKFNVYAILLIAIVIGAVVFFWIQIKNNSE